MNRAAFKKMLVSIRQANEVACLLHYARIFTKHYPEDYYGWAVLGDGLTDFASYREADAALKRALRLAPEYRVGAVCALVGHLHREKGDHVRAEKWYRRAIKEDGPNTLNLVILGGCLAKQGKFQEAKQCHRKAIKLASDPVDEAFFNLGLVLRAEGRLQQAADNFRKSLEIDPNYPPAKRALKDVEKVLALKKKAKVKSSS